MNVTIDKDWTSLRVRELLSRAFVHYCVCHMLRENDFHAHPVYEREKHLFEEIITLKIGVVSSMTSFSIFVEDELRSIDYSSFISNAVERTIRIHALNYRPDHRFRLQDLKEKDLKMTENGSFEKFDSFVDTFCESVGKDQFLIWPRFIGFLRT